MGHIIAPIVENIKYCDQTLFAFKTGFDQHVAALTTQ